MVQSAHSSAAASAKYEKVCELNSGSFGVVHLCKNKVTGQKCAVKFIKRGQEITKYVEREILIHRQLFHPHIVQFQEVFLTQRHLAIAMEFVPGGDLFDYVLRKDGVPEDEARHFFQQIMVGVEYCHRMGVVNRDIKLENSLIDPTLNEEAPTIKICDFGLSKDEKLGSAPRSMVGTHTYQAPEVIQAKGETEYDGKTADVWACGVMLFALLTGDYPFERIEDAAEGPNQKMLKTIMRILTAEYCMPDRVSVSDACADLLARILVVDPQQRITVDGIMRHPWFLQDLPPYLESLNDQPPQLPPQDLQSVEEIKRLVAEARRGCEGSEDDEGFEEGDGFGGPGNSDLDRLIENEIRGSPVPLRAHQRHVFTGVEPDSPFGSAIS